MPRLLILCEYPTLLGGERSMLATLPYVRAAGFDVMVAAPAEGELAAALRDHEVRQIAWQPRDSSSKRFPLDELRDQLARIISGTRPDLLHANSLSTARISGPVASASGIPSIGHLRDIIKLTSQAVDDLNCHSCMIAVSHATRDFHLSQGLAARTCVVLNNGVDSEEFQPRPATGYLHRELGFSRDARFALVVGQLGTRKGTDVALAAAKVLVTAQPALHWLIVGERTSNKPESHEFEHQLRSTAALPPLAGRVHFLGNRSDIPQIMNECTLLVHAARQEPLGRVLLEAAASGLPTVATDVGGTREIFPTESDGAVLIPVDNHDAIAKALTMLLKDPQQYYDLATTARRRAESAFSVELAAPRLIEQYRDVLYHRKDLPDGPAHFESTSTIQ
jgi:glycosyltransferase involved in cell wall biosynthesis